MIGRACDGLVMVVEDDNDLRELIAEVLEDHAYRPVRAKNGKEAFDRLRNRSSKPCVILLDIMMPVMDGLEFRALQKQDPELSVIPVVVLTAHANRQEAANEMGADACLAKPVQLDALLTTIERFCRNDPSARA